MVMLISERTLRLAIAAIQLRWLTGDIPAVLARPTDSDGSYTGVGEQELFNFPLPSLGFPGIGRNRSDPIMPKPDKITYDPPNVDYGEDDGVTEEVESLLRKYAPIIYLHSEEEFWPSSVDYMLPRFTKLLDRYGRTNASLAEAPFNATALGTLPIQNQWSLFLTLSTTHSVNAQPELPPGSENEFLYGPGGETAESRLIRRANGNSGWSQSYEEFRATGIKTQNRSSHLHGSNIHRGHGIGIVSDAIGGSGGLESGTRPVVEAPVYAFYVPLEDGIVDLVYWTYYPYNFGKRVAPLGILGNHVSDWEHLRIRTKHGQAISADYMVHRDLSTTGTLRWADVPKFDGRPVAFSALGSHGLWPTAGEHLYINAFNIIKLVDVTDAGPVWDAKDQLVPIQWRNLTATRWPFKRRHDPRGKLGWLNFTGRWGNQAQRNCWWRMISPDCQMADAPSGPNRDFRQPPQCLIAPLNHDPNRSIYKFKVDHEHIRRAFFRGMKYIELTQTCSRWQETKAGRRGSSNNLDNLVTGGQLAGLAAREDVRLRHRIALKHFDNAFELSTTSCPPHHAISGYVISFCNAKGRCYWRSAERDICTYLRATSTGYTNGRSLIMDDPDPWSWFDWTAK